MTPDPHAQPEPAALNSPTGLLLVDKPYRLSSTSICRVVKRRLINAGAPKRVKVGHAGTLDPLASGLLIILIGKATKLCDRLMADEKRYTATIDLLHHSDTDDYEGNLTRITPPSPLPTLDDIRAALAPFIGLIMQAPPAHSAMMIGGSRAYTLARAGKLHKLEPRPVTIHAIDIIEYAFPHLTLDVHCGKGTYIRSLARDVGAALHTGGCLSALRRTAIGNYHVDNAIALDDVPDPLLQEHLLPPPLVAPDPLSPDTPPPDDHPPRANP